VLGGDNEKTSPGSFLGGFASLRVVNGRDKRSSEQPSRRGSWSQRCGWEFKEDSVPEKAFYTNSGLLEGHF